MRRATQPGGKAVLAVLLLLTASLGQEPGPGERPAAPASGDSRQPKAAEQRRLREGTPLHDRLGAIQSAGDRWVFLPNDESRQFLLLENLGLQRVVDLHTAGHKGLWNVSGSVTEFGGRNYLLLTRAVLKSTPPVKGVAKGVEASATHAIGTGSQ